MQRSIPFVLALLFVAGALPVLGQQSPFLPPDIYDKLTNEISGDIAYDNLRALVMYHAPTGASQGFFDEAKWVEERAKSYGLEDIKFVPLSPWATKEVDQMWTLKGGELWLLEPKVLKLGDVRETPTFVADNSPTADITAELVDVGEGIEQNDYSGRDVTGKVVLAYGPINKVKELACWDHGAAGIVSYHSTRTDPWTDHPDQVAWSSVSASKEGEKPTPPVFIVSPRTGLMLSRWISGHPPTHIFADEKAQPAAPLRFRVHLKIESETSTPGRSGLVEGLIRGTTYHDQAVVLTAHMQEEKTSANDDRSGCANLLEIGRALTAMIRDGRLPRPRRDIRFWWTNEIAAEYAYFAAHPEERQRIIADINEDMVGAKQSLGGRVQHVSRTPYSRWSFLNDVVESVVSSLVQGNNAYLASWQNHNPAPYSRPIFSHLGSREPYHAELVHFFDSTDHMVFNEGAIGIPGVTFTNWPDEFIHSSDDDLWQIDRSQLQRNAVAVAGSALYLANLTEAEVPTLLAVMTGEARERISHDLATGLARMAQAGAENTGAQPSPSRGTDILPVGDLAQDAHATSQPGVGTPSGATADGLHAAYKDALTLLDEAERREVRGFESIRRFAGKDAQKLLESLKEDMKLTELNHQKRIQEWYLALGGKKSSPALNEQEKAADSKVPRMVGNLGDFLKHKQEVEGPKTLHGLMKFEAFNFMDGQRSLLEIFRAVRAESLSAGEWYYGTVKLEDIEALFDAAQKEGAVQIAAQAGAAPAAK